VLSAVRSPFEEVAAHRLDPPLVQPLGLLLDLLGESLRERLFVVQAGDDEPEACLRTDFTIEALKAHLASGRQDGRYAYDGRAFRVAPAGSTRAEEFRQLGLEVFEPGDVVAADAEMAALAWRSACAGGRDDLTLVLGDVSLFSALADSLDLPRPLAMRLKRAFASPRKLRNELDRATGEAGQSRGRRLAEMLETMAEAEASAVLEEIWDLAGIEPVGGRSAGEIVHRLAERARLSRAPSLTGEQAELFNRFLAIEGDPGEAMAAVADLAPLANGRLAALREAWARRVEALCASGVPRERLRFSAAFGRAFGYYDGMVFEVRSAALGDDQPVAAGGRYDGLAERLGAAMSTGAVGCMVRPGRAWAEAAP
jgi:ATP phosphoribosyltransferase regulatory subunit